MIIERMTVEDGFLKDLDIQFSKGLNVIIGPRGCGKTSIIEMIRFCLGVDAMTERFNIIAQKQAIGVLGSGRVSLSLNNRDGKIVVTRSADENETNNLGIEKPIILSQNEIEEIGLDSRGKLKIIDAFREGALAKEEDSCYPLIRSITEEMVELRKEIEQLKETTDNVQNLEEELKIAVKEQEKFLTLHQITEKEQKELQKITQELSEQAVKKNSCERSIKHLKTIINKIKDLTNEVSDTEMVVPLGDDVVKQLKSILDETRKALLLAESSSSSGINLLLKVNNFTSDKVVKLQEESRVLRNKLESVNEGAGNISKRVSQLKEQLALSFFYKNMILSKEKSMSVLDTKRSNILALLESVREQRYKGRKAEIKKLNSELKPRITISIDRLGNFSEYSSILANKLRGSGIQYTSIAQLLAEKMTPKELVEAVEKNNMSLICEAINTSNSKCEKIIDHLKGSNLTDLLTCNIEDVVKFQLLDGSEYKSTEQLSMGQRCTVILPILLCHQGKTLIIDQPEDHLDNAFVANTLIPAIRKHKKSGQIIITTHNPNIPVLGEADRVIYLGSDGKRGFVKSAEELDNDKTIAAITNVMEGGAEAFKKRSDFYKIKRSA